MPLQGLQPQLSSARAYLWAPAVHRKSIGLTGWPTLSPLFLRTSELSRPLYSFSLIQCWPPICLQGQYSCSSLPTSEMRGTSRSSWPDAATPVPSSGKLRTRRLTYNPNGWDGAEERPSDTTRPSSIASGTLGPMPYCACGRAQSNEHGDRLSQCERDALVERLRTFRHPAGLASQSLRGTCSPSPPTRPLQQCVCPDRRRRRA